jgi:hypothetical protein
MASKNSQLFVVACGLAVQAAILVLLNAFIPQWAGTDAMWIAFQAWAMYFLAGCTLLGGIRAFIGYATGIAASIAIIELMNVPGINALPMVNGMNIAMAVAVFIVVIPAIMSENLKNMVPALFVGSGAFFALSTIMAKPGWEGHLAVAQAELVYCAVGLLFGFITVFWRGQYEARLKGR